MIVNDEMQKEINRLLARTHGPMRRETRGDLRALIEGAAGFRMTYGEWRVLAKCAQTSEIQLHRAPPSSESRKKVEDLEQAAKAFRAAAMAVLPEMTTITLYIGHPKPLPAARELDGLILDQIADADWLQDEYFEGADFLKDCLPPVKAIEDACTIRLKGIAPPLKGQKIAGYDLFLKACRVVWSRHFEGEGYKKVGGKWKGAFIEFVFAAQCLIPETMHRKTRDATGEAIQSWFDRGEPYVGG